MANTNALVKFQENADFNPMDIAERFKVAHEMGLEGAANDNGKQTIKLVQFDDRAEFETLDGEVIPNGTVALMDTNSFGTIFQTWEGAGNGPDTVRALWGEPLAMPTDGRTWNEGLSITFVVPETKQTLLFESTSKGIRDLGRKIASSVRKCPDPKYPDPIGFLYGDSYKSAKYNKQIGTPQFKIMGWYNRATDSFYDNLEMPNSADFIHPKDEQDEAPRQVRAKPRRAGLAG